MDATTLVIILLQTLIVSLFSLCLALFSYFLDFCFWRHNVFGFWLPFLAKSIVKRKNKLKYDYILKLDNSETQTEMFLDNAATEPLYKVLGGCSICLNIWIGFASYPVILLMTGFSWWFMILYLFLASFILRKIQKVD
jgi:hypothetical protein